MLWWMEINTVETTFNIILLYCKYSSFTAAAAAAAKSLQSYLTLCDPIDGSPPGSSIMGFSRQEHWSELPFPSPRDLPNPGIKPASSVLAGEFFTTGPPGKPGPLLLLFSRSVVSDSLWPHELQHAKASLSFMISQSLLKLMSIELVMPSNHLILCHPLLLLPSIFPSVGVFSMSQFFA